VELKQKRYCISDESGAEMLLSAFFVKATILIRQLHSQLFHPTKEGRLVNTQFPGRRQTVKAISLKCRPNGLGVKNGVDRSQVCFPGCCNMVAEQFSRQMRNLNASCLTEDKGPFDEVFKFPDVAGPVMNHQQGESFCAHVGDGLLLQAIESIDKLAHKKRDVFFASPQSGQFDTDDIHTVIKIFAKDFLFHLFREILVCGDDNPGISRLGTDAAKRFIAPFLQHSQQSDLKSRGDLTDFIEENGPALSQSESSWFVLVGAGEGPSLITEKF